MGLLSSKISQATKMAANPDIMKFIEHSIAQEKVVIFSKTCCPYSKMAKEVFQKVNQPFKAIELNQRNDGSDIQDNLKTITGFRTVPQVFVNGKCIGGGTDVRKLYDTGKLEPILNN